MPPVSPGKYSPGGSVASANSTPLEAVEPKHALTRDNDTLHYEKTVSGDDNADAESGARNKRSRRLISGLLLESSKSFAEAFASAGSNGSPAKRAAPSLVTAGIGTYAHSTDSLEDEKPRRGKTLSLRS